MGNGTLMQYFEWDLVNDGKHWQRLKDDAEHLKEIGITAVWLPPCFKAIKQDDVGYGVYDLYDLGEFDQKGTIRTKYGTREELKAAIDALHEVGIQVYADVVLNHKAGADHTENFLAVPVAEDDRHCEIGEVREIEAWVGFDFLGRQGLYSDFKWHWYHFSGVDYDVRSGETSIFKIQGDFKDWADDDAVNTEHGNFDYIIFADIDYDHPEVVEETFNWLKWFVEETSIDGMRIDAAKHIDSRFINDLINEARQEFGEDFFFVAEYWDGDYQSLVDFLDSQEFDSHIFDSLLHFKFAEVSQGTADVDIRSLVEDTIMARNPTLAVTFVSNHDTQPGQSLESLVEPWFKAIAYGWILLSAEGYPCIFYGDYYGLGGEASEHTEILDKLLYLRQNYAYGSQDDYFDHQNVIAFIRHGDKEYSSPLVVILSNGAAGEKSIFVGEEWSGRAFYDYLGFVEDPVFVDDDGSGDFKVSAGSISCWLPVDENN